MMDTRSAAEFLYKTLSEIEVLAGKVHPEHVPEEYKDLPIVVYSRFHGIVYQTLCDMEEIPTFRIFIYHEYMHNVLGLVEIIKAEFFKKNRVSSPIFYFQQESPTETGFFDEIRCHFAVLTFSLT